jgi:hypothetical protein
MKGLNALYAFGIDTRGRPKCEIQTMHISAVRAASSPRLGASHQPTLVPALGVRLEFRSCRGPLRWNDQQGTDGFHKKLIGDVDDVV